MTRGRIGNRKHGRNLIVVEVYCNIHVLKNLKLRYIYQIIKLVITNTGASGPVAATGVTLGCDPGWATVSLFDSY